MQDAVMLFEEALEHIEPDAIMYSVVMGAVANDGRKVKRLYQDMLERGIPADDVIRWQVKKASQGARRGSGGGGGVVGGGGGGRGLKKVGGMSKSFVPAWRRDKASVSSDLGWGDEEAEGQGRRQKAGWDPRDGSSVDDEGALHFEVPEEFSAES